MPDALGGQAFGEELEHGTLPAGEPDRVVVVGADVREDGCLPADQRDQGLDEPGQPDIVG